MNGTPIEIISSVHKHSHGGFLKRPHALEFAAEKVHKISSVHNKRHSNQAYRPKHPLRT